MRYQSPVRWIGGKSAIAKWIVGQFPTHHTYVEPFGGGAAVLLAKVPSPVEVYNDLDDRLFRIFSVLRERRLTRRLLRSLFLTPYSEKEFKEAWRRSLPDDPVEAARICIVRLRMAFGGAGSRGTKPGFGFGKTSNQARQFANFRNQLLRLNERLANVTVMSRSALSVIEVFDDSNSLIYCDPPYVPASRKSSRDYVHEFAESDHQALDRVERIVQAIEQLAKVRDPKPDGSTDRKRSAITRRQYLRPYGEHSRANRLSIHAVDEWNTHVPACVE